MRPLSIREAPHPGRGMRGVLPPALGLALAARGLGFGLALPGLVNITGTGQINCDVS